MDEKKGESQSFAHCVLTVSIDQSRSLSLHKIDEKEEESRREQASIKLSFEEITESEIIDVEIEA